VDVIRVEGFELTLTNATGGADLGSQSTTVLGIVDNDSELEFSQAVFPALEAAGYAEVTVTRRGSLREPVIALVETMGGRPSRGWTTSRNWTQ